MFFSTGSKPGEIFVPLEGEGVWPKTILLFNHYITRNLFSLQRSLSHSVSESSDLLLQFAGLIASNSHFMDAISSLIALRILD